MFGHQDEPVQQAMPQNDQVVAPNPALPPADMNFGQLPSVPVTDPNSLLEPQAADGYTSSLLPPLDPNAQALPEPTQAPDIPAPAQATQIPQDQMQPATVGTPSPLNDLKQQALQQLSPLVDQLEQTPEEKFRTTMMMIQASDNQDLLQSAYDAANQITDEKSKAQALLDIINEINYFSQKSV